GCCVSGVAGGAMHVVSRWCSCGTGAGSLWSCGDRTETLLL
ncbi:MAG: hypothetical protein AVDCRST_MAG16-870, partial [uncultured Frankineae bacterium]